MQKLGVVSESFNITGRGCILGVAATLEPVNLERLRIKTGTELELHREGEILLRAKVGGIPTGPLLPLAILVLDIDKSFVQRGDEIWLEDAAFPVLEP